MTKSSKLQSKMSALGWSQLKVQQGGNQKASKDSFQATTFKVEENSTTFQGLAQKFKDFSRKNGIQGLFKDFS